MESRKLKKLTADLFMLLSVMALAVVSYLLAFNREPNGTAGQTLSETTCVESSAAADSVNGNPVASVENSSEPAREIPAQETAAQAPSPRPASRAPTLMPQVAPSIPDSAADEEEDVSVPLAFIKPPPEFVPNAEQQAEINWMRQEFVAAVGDPGQDPAAYRRRWQKAQQRQDEHFRLMFGDDAFNALQAEAVGQDGGE